VAELGTKESRVMTYIAPKKGLLSFTCPHCAVVARQYHWGYSVEQSAGVRFNEHTIAQSAWSASLCEHCKKMCLWVGDQRAYPNTGTAPQPNTEMPAGPKSDYLEATRIAAFSPRASAALLRLAIQKLCIHLGGSGTNLNDDIGALVAKGLPVQIQQALDVVRVVGNNAVHPGQIDANDSALAEKLFPLVNLIVEYMIELPKRTTELYGSLPDGAKAAIAKRDNQSGAT
jgi:hypothetical protein